MYYFTKYAKYIGIAAVILGRFSDVLIFSWLSLFAFTIFIEMAFDFSTYKGSFLQIVGLLRIRKKYGKDLPDRHGFHSTVVYDLPFEGAWTVVNGCFTEEFSHSWGIPTQRYAYDFLMLDQNGQSYSGDPKNVESYYCYAQTILAPADGEVVEVAAHEAETILLGKGRFFNQASQIAGNYVVIKHGEAEYSTLAHLKKDSILVKVGATVLRGEKIAACGNTGNSTEPHLHFQLQDGPSFYDSAGLPIRFSHVKLETPANYQQIDPRPQMPVDQIPEGYITRGFNVSNDNDPSTFPVSIEKR
ncbi:M23 family metallopeptidase [Anoxynatronum sibiricum]|uniref:M23 family metallopeptidase n=1 Tax=Anoxynatronum sibiricum TaxID=210623 RepID=UPI0031B84677